MIASAETAFGECLDYDSTRRLILRSVYRHMVRLIWYQFLSKVKRPRLSVIADKSG